MQDYAYYDQSSALWSSEEDANLLDEYKNQNKDIMEIGYIHKRTPGCISSRLRKHGLITSNKEARGYDNYVASDLYKEIIKNGSPSRRSYVTSKESPSDVKLEDLYAEFPNAGAPWSEEECQQLIDEMNNKMPFLEICKKHKRLPSGIFGKLKSLKLISAMREVNGYLQYINSELYNKFATIKQVRRAEKRKNTDIPFGKPTIPVNTYVPLTSRTAPKIKNLYDSSNIVNLHMFKRSTAHEDELNKIKQENIALKNTIECLKMENMAYEIKDLKSKLEKYNSK